MYRRLLRKIAQHAFTALERGDTRWAEHMLSHDAHFQFPGRHPFAADHRRREDIEQWLARLAHFQPHFEVHDVVADGWPWDMRACVHFTDRIGDPTEVTPYVNEGVCWSRLRWGRIVEQKIFLDTQAVADFFGSESPEEFFSEMPESR